MVKKIPLASQTEADLRTMREDILRRMPEASDMGYSSLANRLMEIQDRLQEFESARPGKGTGLDEFTKHLNNRRRKPDPEKDGRTAEG